MTSNQRNWLIFLSAFAATALASIAFLSAVGVNDENSRIALRLSARIAFVILLVVFVARPLQQLFTTPFTAKLLRNRRLFGVAFAGIHTAHLGLIFHHLRVVPDFDFNFVAYAHTPSARAAVRRTRWRAHASCHRHQRHDGSDLLA